VHVVNLLASETAEAGLFARLARRLERARSAVGAVGDVLGSNEEGLMAACLGLDGGSIAVPARPELDEKRAVPRALTHVDLAGAARELATDLALQRRLLGAAAAARRSRTARPSVRRAGGILAAAVRRSRLPVLRDRCGLLVLFRVGSAAQAGLGACDELVPVFAEGPCPRLLRRRDIRDRASEALTALVPRMAEAIPPLDVSAAEAAAEFDRDARLAGSASARRTVQRGLFDRRAEREAEDAESAAVTAGPSGPAAGRTPRPVLLLFVTA
jgi:hypothetical protein